MVPSGKWPIPWPLLAPLSVILRVIFSPGKNSLRSDSAKSLMFRVVIFSAVATLMRLKSSVKMAPWLALAYFKSCSSTLTLASPSSTISTLKCTMRSSSFTRSSPARARARLVLSLPSARSCNSFRTLFKMMRSSLIKPVLAIFRMRPSIKAEVST